MSARTNKRAEKENKKEIFSEEESRTASPTTFRNNCGQSALEIIPTTPEAVDDLIRNFLRRTGLGQTLTSFEAEWHGAAQKRLTQTLRMTATEVFFIPDALTHRHLLQSELEIVQRETDLCKQKVLKEEDDLARLRRESDFHRQLNESVAKDKNRLVEDTKQLKEHLNSYEPALNTLDIRYQEALREKMLISIKKDKVPNTVKASGNVDPFQMRKERGTKRINSADNSPPQRTMSRHLKAIEFPICNRMVKSHQTQVNSGKLKSLSLSCSIHAHKFPINCIDLHPHKRILASASDDCSWRIWALAAEGEKVGEMILKGEVQSDWLSGCSFHPDGDKLATTGGDSMVRIWDFTWGHCTLTLSGHSQATGGCSFHSCGHFLASCSSDRTVKVWDLNSEKCTLTLHYHTASVNCVRFLPYSNLFLTGSADKTIALWDARHSIGIATFRGHQHPCNHIAFSLACNLLASCDSGGIINLWDVRNPVQAIASVDVGPFSTNQVAFSPSGKMLAVASSDNLVRVVGVDTLAVGKLSGHRDSVQSITFDHMGGTVISAGTDGMINIWS